jgi:hypothetical protein
MLCYTCYAAEAIWQMYAKLNKKASSQANTKIRKQSLNKDLAYMGL